MCIGIHLQSLHSSQFVLDLDVIIRCIDVLHSASRLFSQLTTGEHSAAAARFRELLATYNNAEDLIKIGAYQHGSSPLIDEAIQRHDQFNSYLRQERTSKVDHVRAVEELMSAVAVEGRR